MEKVTSRRKESKTKLTTKGKAVVIAGLIAAGSVVTHVSAEPKTQKTCTISAETTGPVWNEAEIITDDLEKDGESWDVRKVVDVIDESNPELIDRGIYWKGQEITINNTTICENPYLPVSNISVNRNN